MRFRLTPALVLLLLSPFIGEVMSTSTPPLSILFNPLGDLFLFGLYGCGAILIREIAFLWRKGWPSIVALGASYGIIEEGLMCKSFFDPGWGDMKLHGAYGRLLGVNWVWTLELTLFHAAFSIGAAILLVWLAFPAMRDRRWVGNSTLVACGVIFLFVVVFGHYFITPYRPGIALSGLALVAAAALIGVAWLLPRPSHRAIARIMPGPLLLFLAGFGWTLVLFLLDWALRGLGITPVISFGLMLIHGLVGLAILAWLFRKGAFFTDRHKLALVAGGLSFFVLLDLLFEFAGVPGMSLAGLAMLALIVVLWRKLPKSGSTTAQVASLVL